MNLKPALMSNPLFKYIIRFILVFLAQVLIFNNIQFSGYVNPYFYIWFILVLPFDTPGWIVLLIAFFMGLGIDLFPQGISGGHPSFGLHTSASVLIAFLRPNVWKWISPRDNYDPNTNPDPHDYGWIWFIGYLMIMVGVHHLVLFFLEDFSILHVLRTFFRTILSVAFTIISILIWEALRPTRIL